MSCTNNINTNCGCENNPCGCKTSTDDVVYQGPALDCIGVANCDTLTSVFESIDSFICGPGMVQTIINNIINNISLYNQFTTIVNNTVDCNTVWGCETTTTSTSSSTTTTTTTIKSCSTYRLETTGPSVSSGDSDWSAIDCNTGLPVGETIVYPINSDTGCIVDGSLVLGNKVLILATDSCAVFELDPNCCDKIEPEYISLASSTPIGTVVYASDGYCYTVISTSLLSPTVTLGSATTYANCGECTTANPCPTTTTTTTLPL